LQTNFRLQGKKSSFSLFLLRRIIELVGTGRKKERERGEGYREGERGLEREERR